MLQLTPIDNDIYCKFRAEFPEFAVGIVEESTLKSEDMKAVSITVDCIVFFSNNFAYLHLYFCFRIFILCIQLNMYAR